MNLTQLVKELGLPVGLLIASLYYIVFRTVPKSVYDDVCTDRKEMTKAVTALTERIGILLDREGVRIA